MDMSQREGIHGVSWDAERNAAKVFKIARVAILSP